MDFKEKEQAAQKKNEQKNTEQVKLADKLNVLDEQKNLYIPLTPEEAKKERESTKTRLSERFEKAKTRKLTVKKAERNGTVKSITRVTKKHLLKKDETVTEKVFYYETGEKLADIRQENAEFLRRGSFDVKDLKADYRMSTDISVKAAVGYEPFKQLSQFYPDMSAEGMKAEDFNELVKKYGKKEGTPDRFEVLDKLTEKILGINPSDFDFSSDSAMAQKAARFENMNAMVSAYRELLEDNPHYAEHLKNTKDEGENESYFNKLQKQMVILTAMSDYYRIRKMIMSDSEYIAYGADIEQEIKETDSKGTRHLKEMLRASYHIASNLNRLIGKSDDMDVLDLSSGKNKLSRDSSERIDKVFFTSKRKLLKAGDDATEVILKREDGIRDELDRLQREADFIADIKIRNAMGELTDISRTVYDKKEKKYKKVKYTTPFLALYSGAAAVALDVQFGLDVKKEEKKRPDQLERIEDLGKKTHNGTISHNFEFGSKKYPELDKLSMSDIIERMKHKLMLDLNDDLSDSEIVELVEQELLSSEKNFFEAGKVESKKAEGKELTEEEKKVKPIAPEVYEYYEEAYIDAAMRSIYRHFALFERIEQTLGAKALILHPSDLLIKYPEEAQQLINSAVTVTNIIERKSADTLQGFIEKYNKDYSKRNKYKVDAQKFVDSADLYGSITMKLVGFTYTRFYLANIYREDKGMDPMEDEFTDMYSEEHMERIRKNVGKMGITAEKIDQCYEQHKNDTVVKLMQNSSFKNSINPTDDGDSTFRSAVYLYYHPEVLNSKMAKLITNSFAVTARGTQPPDAFRRAFKHGYVRDFTKKELQEYEADLKRRGMPPVNVDVDGNILDENDPYYLKVYYDVLAEEEAKEQEAKKQEADKNSNDIV